MVYLEELNPTRDDLEDPRGYYESRYDWPEIYEKANLYDLKFKIIDYGFGIPFKPDQEIKIELTHLGDERVNAPEAAMEDNYDLKLESYDERIDIYGIGNTFFFLLTNRLISMNVHDDGLLGRITKDEWAIRLYNL